ncbi:ABC transporter permease, partial [Thomasclavelia sp.]|uniref:ABC transporter permease n=1 Tax=Thomasclavelia sp. TaxID=3025757 RepID=UPI0025F959CD
MINIVKSDIVRMLKSKSFWITLVAFLSLFVAIIFMQNSSQNGTVFDATNGGREEGLYITIDTIVKSLNSFVTTFGYSFGLLFLGIYLSIFICNEYSSGYIKNIATLNNGRISIIVAKIVVAIVLIL